MKWKKTTFAALAAIGGSVMYYTGDSPTEKEARAYCEPRGMKIRAISEKSWACLDNGNLHFIPKNNELPVRGRPQ